VPQSAFYLRFLDDDAASDEASHVAASARFADAGRLPGRCTRTPMPDVSDFLSDADASSSPPDAGCRFLADADIFAAMPPSG